MKKALHLMMALLFFVGMASAQVTIDFETGDFSQLSSYNVQNASTPSGTPWVVIPLMSSTGNYCMQSGNAGVHSSTSEISISVGFAEPGFIEFDANCMGESSYDLYDVCAFFIDGEQQFAYGQDLEGWHTFGFNVTAGSHVFTWTYTKDIFANSEGDSFQVDNITFGLGTACAVTFELQVVSVAGNTVELKWLGTSESYTLRYKKGSDSWTTIPGITENEYTLENLSTGAYSVEVKSDCAAESWASSSFYAYAAATTADWFCFAYSATDPELKDRFVSFKMGDIATLTAANDAMNHVYAAVFVKGDVLYCGDNMESSGYSLYKAPVNINDRTIGDSEVLIADFASDRMSYNPANGLMYYVDENNAKLKSFDPANPGPVTTYGDGSSIGCFAINNEGEAYAMGYDSETGNYGFCTLDLTNVRLTLMKEFDGVADLAFDLSTGELFGFSMYRTYYNNHENGDKFYLGALGDDNGFIVTSPFMVYDWDAVAESNVESVNLYPNPTQGQVTVEGTGVLSVVNMLGQTVLTQEIEGQATIELTKGMYIVRLNNAISKVIVE